MATVKKTATTKAAQKKAAQKKSAQKKGAQKKGAKLYQVVAPATEYNDEYMFSVSDGKVAINNQLFPNKAAAEKAALVHRRSAAMQVIGDSRAWLPDFDIDDEENETIAFKEAFQIGEETEDIYIFFDSLQKRLAHPDAKPLSDKQVLALIGICPLQRVEIVELEIVDE